MDSKHGATGTELRLDVCVKDGSERTWSHEQVRPGAGGGGAGTGRGQCGNRSLERPGRSPSSAVKGTPSRLPLPLRAVLVIH